MGGVTYLAVGWPSTEAPPTHRHERKPPPPTSERAESQSAPQDARHISGSETFHLWSCSGRGAKRPAR
eukprot:4811593-Prymnesium_polylepis.1